MRLALACAVLLATASSAASSQRPEVVAEIKSQVREKIGRKWENVAVRIAYVESRHNPRAIGPKTKHGRAAGVMQVMPGSARALGYDPRRLHEMKYGIAAGVAHMKACLKSGVQTDRQMAACHVSGVAGWKRNTRSNLRYVELVMKEGRK
jgi:soluble lytic murein transglycosylase-like protein